MSHTTLDGPAREWITSVVGSGARIVAVQRLVGGITAAVHGVVVQDRTGYRQSLVIRRWTQCAPAAAAQCVRDEAQVLAGLMRTQVAAPRLVAIDPLGRATEGVPAILMTRLPGRVHLRPDNPERWLRQLAVTLVRIHSTEALNGFPDRFQSPASATTSVGTWAPRPHLWRALTSLSGSGAHATSVALVHGDYQHFNVLWVGERLTGVVDWVSAGRGTGDYDVGHAELNLAVLSGSEWAKRFREAYEAEAGRRVDPASEAHALLEYGPGWASFIPIQVGRRAVVDVAGMHERVEDLVSDVLQRAHR